MKREIAQKQARPGLPRPTNGKGQLNTLASALVGRYLLSRTSGLTYSGDRNLDTQFGYKTSLEYDDYFSMFERRGMAERLVNAFPAKTWRTSKQDAIEVSDRPEDRENETAFETAWLDLDRKIGIFRTLKRADVLACIGQYSVLLAGFDGGENLAQPLTAGAKRNLLYLRAYSEKNAAVKTFEENAASPRYGLPLTYELNVELSSGKASKLLAHSSRIVHIAHGGLDNDVVGTPLLRSIFDWLQDLIKCVGAGAETYWRTAFGGFLGTVDENSTDPTTTELSTLKDEIDEYYHNLRRVLVMSGMKLSPIASQPNSPDAIARLLIELIAGSKGIPVRILLGSEHGELASTQDERAWNERIQERQVEYAEPVILRPLVDLLVTAGALPTPEGEDYRVTWPDLLALSDDEKATVATKKTEAMSKAAGVSGIEMLFSEGERREACGFDAELPPDLNQQIEEMEALEEEAQARADAKMEADAKAAQAAGSTGTEIPPVDEEKGTKKDKKPA